MESIELRDTVVKSVDNGPIEIHVTDENGLEHNVDEMYVNLVFCFVF